MTEEKSCLFSVLISVYMEDNPTYLDVALRSVYHDQVLKPAQIVLVCDGPLGFELDVIVAKWSTILGEVLLVVRSEINIGLADALNLGLSHCLHELVARMDADDIAHPDRFSSQINRMLECESLAVLSAWVNEVEADSLEPISLKKVPTSTADIRKFATRRNPINHPVAVFKRSSVQAVGGYPSFRKSQDYALWSLMLSKGYEMENVDRALLTMRAGSGLMQRRGLTYLVYEIELLRFQRKIGFISRTNAMVNFFIRLCVRLSPKFVKKKLYRLIRR